MSEEMVVYDAPQADLTMSRAPEVVLAEARKAATALGDVLKNKKKPVTMNGEQYLEFEDWQTVGRFYGVTAKVASTEYVEFNGVVGFQARAVAIRPDGMEVSAAEAMCLSDEPNWNKKPMFQLRSMAQTRACAKALRNVLAWVVVLAGYKGTPAEEIADMTSGRENVAMPQEKAAHAPNSDKPATIKDPDAPITDPQLKAIGAILSKLGIQDDMARHKKVSNILALTNVIPSMRQLTKGQASEVIQSLSDEANK